ncbi:MAG: gliding motility-associated C-terminal domain-containing protein [Flavobacteriales bacterium]|nr:gliding motility-associated C-terminal domain-containing protein [Flavobacteriales bacterium]
MKEISPENRFDDLLRSKLDGFEMPFDADAWTRFESKLAPQPPASTIGSTLLKSAVGALVLGGMATGAYLLWPSAGTPETLVVNDRSIEAPSPDPEQDSESVSGESAQFAQPATFQHEARTAGTAKEKPETSPTETKVLPASVEPERAERSATHQSENDVNSEEERVQTESTQNQAALNLAIKMNKGTVCVGEELRLMAVTGTGGMEFAWHFSDGEKRSRTEATRHFDASGTYEVTLVASRGKQTWERTASIQVQPLPMAEFELVRPIEGIPIYDLNIVLAEGDRCRWTFSDGRVSDEPNTRQLFRRRGDAGVELMVTNAHGCTSVERRTINIAENFHLFAVNTFTPNGDGTNDDFLPKALETMECDFEMVMNDLSGREVYRTVDLNAPWNGRENNTGKMLPSGPYIWTIVLKNSIMHDPVFRGEITLQQ